MPDTTSRVATSGHCICGAIAFSAKVASEFHACHCTTCQRWASGAFFGVHASALKIEDDSSLVAYASSDWATREFCSKCGTSLFWRANGSDDVIVSLGTLDNASDLVLQREIFVDKRLKSYAFAGDHPRLTGAELLASLGLNGPEE